MGMGLFENMNMVGILIFDFPFALLPSFIAVRVLVAVYLVAAVLILRALVFNLNPSLSDTLGVDTEGETESPAPQSPQAPLPSSSGGDDNDSSGDDNGNSGENNGNGGENNPPETSSSWWERFLCWRSGPRKEKRIEMPGEHSPSDED